MFLNREIRNGHFEFRKASCEKEKPANDHGFMRRIKNEIPSNLSEFEQALRKIFGPGASYLEKLIISHLYNKLGLPPQEIHQLNLTWHVNNLKNQFYPERRK